MIKLHERTKDLRYWEMLMDRETIGAITNRAVDSVGQWKYYDVPNDARLLLSLYVGELTLGEWEDYVNERAPILRAQTYNARSRQAKDEARTQKAKEENDRLESRCGI
jgi:hypothetical protein